MARTAAAGQGRGRNAERPTDIPPTGWLDIAYRVRRELGRDKATLLAAGVGLFALLAAFPALAALVSLYGLFASPSDVAVHLESLEGLVPGDALDIFRSQLTSLAAEQGGSLGVGVLLSLLVALWSARKGMVAIMQACNVAYEEEEKRGFLRQIVVSLGFTAGAIVYCAVTLAIGAALPIVIGTLFGDSLLTSMTMSLRWVVLWLFIALALGVIYRYAPSRSRAKWRWISWGSIVAATLWIVGGILFELYVRSFGTFGETYGALGGVVILLLWLYLSGFVVVLGAEINAEMEHQTARDSTTGPAMPLGERGAYVADTIGRARE